MRSTLSHEGLELRLGGESTHEVKFPADARAVVTRTTEDTAHTIPKTTGPRDTLLKHSR